MYVESQRRHLESLPADLRDLFGGCVYAPAPAEYTLDDLGDEIGAVAAEWAT